jgi:heterotetrameric sarcosine oxidase delta subunit
MLRLNCPVCGPRDETEFVYGGDASVVRPPLEETDPGVWLDYVFLRDNPRGGHQEYWHHVQGCRQWVVQERDTLTHERGDCRLAKDSTR